MSEPIRATAPADLIAASMERRTITGRVLPWGVAATPAPALWCSHPARWTCPTRSTG